MKLHLIIILLLSSLIVNGQDTVPKFSLNDAINYALKNQFNVTNATYDEKIAGQKVNELTGLGTPQINGEASINKFIEIPTSFLPDFITPLTYRAMKSENLITEERLKEILNKETVFFPVKFGQAYTASAGVTITQLLFDGSYFAGLQASHAYREFSRKQLKQTKIETAVTVSKAYYNVLVSKQRLALVNKNVERLRKLRNDIKATYDAGFVEKLDFDRVDLTYNNITVQQANAKRLAELSYALLKFQMGMDVNATIELTDSLNEEKWGDIQMPEKPDPKNRIEYSVLQSAHRLQELDLKRYRLTYLPSLTAFGSVSANASRDEFNFFNSDYRWFPTAIIGAKLSLPIWDGLQKNARVQQSKLALKKVDNSLLNLEQSINLDYYSAKTNLQNNIDLLQTSRINRDIANEIVRASKIKYDNGVGSSLEVVDSESSLKEAETNYYSALYEAIVAKIDLDKALGNLNY